VNPWLHLVANQPQLLAEHAQAYAELAAAQIAAVSADWKQRALLVALAAGGLLVAATLGGVAVLLWSVTAAPQSASHWVLVTTPAVPAAVAVACLVALRLRRPRGSANALRKQFEADLLVWRAGVAS
jgi:hypothetical protein